MPPRLMNNENDFNNVPLDVFKPWPKTPRVSAHCIITEKIDGTNGQISICEDGRLFVGSRNRWLSGETKQSDNFGFYAWVMANETEIRKLGVGRHFGEWYGAGIGMRYGWDTERFFSLFNTRRPAETLPSCIGQVPVLYEGPFSKEAEDQAKQSLMVEGSRCGSLKWTGKSEGYVVFFPKTGERFKHVFETEAKKQREEFDGPLSDTRVELRPSGTP